MLLSVLGCGVLPALAERLKFGGTGSGTVLMKRLADEYCSTHPGEHVEVVPYSLGSGGGVRALSAGKIDLAILGRSLKDDERLDGFRAVAWARTPLVLATSGGEVADGLNVPLLVDILLGRRTTWDDGSRIRLVMRIAQETDTLILANLSPDLKRALDAYLSSPGAVVADTDVDALDLLARTPGSLGTTTLGLISLRKSTVVALPFADAEPSLRALEEGRYTLAKELHLVYPENPSPQLSRFIEWLFSASVAERLRELAHQPLFP
ncbi:MAG: substrate-binding domain-containing protein [Acidobacteriota bacterium]